MESQRNNSTPENSQNIQYKHPISCPWVSAQPYPSTLNKNRACETSLNKAVPHIPISIEPRSSNEKTCPSLQQSSSQFFYFLRLMQLFPETHPATLHTVLSLCKNDFFCAVDKLLYAKRCKALYSRSQTMFKKCSLNRPHPYCTIETCKNYSQKDKCKENIGCSEHQMFKPGLNQNDVKADTVADKHERECERNEVKSTLCHLKEDEQKKIDLEDVQIIVAEEKTDGVELQTGDIITIDLTSTPTETPWQAKDIENVEIPLQKIEAHKNCQEFDHENVDMDPNCLEA